MDEEKSIKAAVEERKQRARSLGIVDTIFKLFIGLVQFLGRNPDRDVALLPEGTTATRTKSGPGSLETITVNAPGQVYTFSWEEEPPIYVPGKQYASLRLSVGKQPVLEISCERKEWALGWGDWEISKYADVRAFREGSWVEGISRFASQVDSIDARRKAEAARQATLRETEDLKKRFGL